MITSTSTAVRLGALAPAQMQAIHAPAPGYRAPAAAPAVTHADAVQQLWGGRLTPMMAAAETRGRFAGAALTCPPTACTGMLTLAAGARSRPYRNPDAIENIFCDTGRIEQRPTTGDTDRAIQHRHQLQDRIGADAGLGDHSAGSFSCALPPPQAIGTPSSGRWKALAALRSAARALPCARTACCRSRARAALSAVASQSAICASAMVRVVSKWKSTLSLVCGPQ